MEQWAEGVHARIATAIRASRGRRSAQWLADRTAELGHPITRAQITNYENGRKASLDVADLIVLAAALGTSPVCLVFPGPYDEEVSVFPGVGHTQLSAAEWFSALRWISGVGEDMGGEWADLTAELRSGRRLFELELARKHALYRHIKAGRPAETADELAAELALYDAQISELKRDLGISYDA